MGVAEIVREKECSNQSIRNAADGSIRAAFSAGIQQAINPTVIIIVAILINTSGSRMAMASQEGEK